MGRGDQRMHLSHTIACLHRGPSAILCSPNSLHGMKAGGREGSRDYGAETAIFISTLIVVYLVRRQINQVSEDHDWEGERVVMTDRQGKTNIRGVAALVEDKNEVLM